MRAESQHGVSGSKGQPAPTTRAADGTGGDLAVLKEFESLVDHAWRLMKAGRYNEDALAEAHKLDGLLEANRELIRRKAELLFYKSTAIVAEVYDYFGDVKGSLRVARDGAVIYDMLPEKLPTDGPSNPEREILREKVRVCLDYIQAQFYRAHRYEEARIRIERCLAFVREQLRDEDEFPCYGTLGQIMYYLGRTHRQMGNYDEAERCFEYAIDYYYRRFYFRRARATFEEKRVDVKAEKEFANYRMAVCQGLGLAWVNYTRGYLRKALYQIQSARTFLAEEKEEKKKDKKDKKASLNHAYVELIYGSIRRALDDPKRDGLKEAIAAIKQAYEIFSGQPDLAYHHELYKARAAHELAIAYFHLGQWDEAETRVEEVRAIANEYQDPRWMCNSLILESRILRKKKPNPEGWAEAENKATQALEMAEERRQLSCQISACIARAEVRMDLGRYADARQDLQEALNLMQAQGSPANVRPTNPKIEAVCYLHLARSYAREDDDEKARHYFEQWKKLEDRVEHRFVDQLAEDVEREIGEIKVAGRFIISVVNTESLNYKRNLAELKRFLLTEARAQAKKKEEVARLLGITRQALHNWEKELARHG